ncbi:serine hydrolase domain-containing protein [Inquilinus sp. YAF38]|uniref:serine hydrolase domain-containing protein n=1 Tax=Inquilinus sp. YAF38 TaxID=3233084 RepID=UPI003F901FC0
MTGEIALTARSLKGNSAGAIDAAVDEALAESRIVGCVVLVAEDGKLVYERAAGHADRETGRQMRVDTPFRLASVTKPFTTMAALKLMEAGRLSPEDGVTKYLPEFRPRLQDGSAADIRIAHLMAHMAGLDYRFQQPVDGAYARAQVSDGLDESQESLAANIARIASVPLDRRPGEGWRYSVATDVLGGVIEAVTGTALGEAIRTLVCDPLRLDAAFHWPGDELAVPYRDGEPQPVRMTAGVEVPLPFGEGPGVRFDPERIRTESTWPSGGAGMAGRARDVLTLLEAHRSGDLLRDDLRQAARLPRVGAEAQAAGPGWGFSWLGAVLIDPAEAASGWSKGSVSWGGVYGASWGIDFERKRTVVSLTNTAYEGMFGKFSRSIAAATSGPAT